VKSTEHSVLSTVYSPRHHCNLGWGSDLISSTSVYRGSNRGEQSQIVLPQEAGEKPLLSSDLSDTPWINHRRPGSLYNIIEYE
jgi:hypothetical protein